MLLSVGPKMCSGFIDLTFKSKVNGLTRIEEDSTFPKRFENITS